MVSLDYSRYASLVQDTPIGFLASQQQVFGSL